MATLGALVLTVAAVAEGGLSFSDDEGFGDPGFGWDNVVLRLSAVPGPGLLLAGHLPALQLDTHLTGGPSSSLWRDRAFAR